MSPISEHLYSRQKSAESPYLAQIDADEKVLENKVTLKLKNKKNSENKQSKVVTAFPPIIVKELEIKCSECQPVPH